jgi:hypothetical protein
MNDVDYCVRQVKIESSEVFKITMNIQHGFYCQCMNIKSLPIIIKQENRKTMIEGRGNQLGNALRN